MSLADHAGAIDRHEPGPIPGALWAPWRRRRFEDGCFAVGGRAGALADVQTVRRCGSVSTVDSRRFWTLR